MSEDVAQPKHRTVGDSGEGSAPRSRSAVSFVQLSQLVRGEGKRRYQRVLLLNPAATLFHADLPRCTYPLGIGYIAAVLERHGYEVRILDVFAAGYDRGLPLEEDASFIRYGSPLDEVEAVLREFHPDVVGVSNIFSNQADNVHELLQLAKRTLPEVVTAVGGAHARYFPKACLEDSALDAVFLGESEFTFLRWLQHLNGAVDASELRGVAYRQDGKVTIVPESPLISSRSNDAAGLGARGVVFEGELDGIPFPAWHLYDMERYFDLKAYQSPYTVGGRVGQIYTSRGCTAQCTFCTTTNFWGNRLRGRSVDNVVSELEVLKSRYGIDEFHVQDDNVTNDMGHARELFKALTAVGLPWATPQGTALWRMDEEMLDLMAASGAYQVTFAIESGVQRVLRQLIRKPLNLDKTKHLIGYARSLGLHTHAFFIIGMPPMFGKPGETLGEMRQSYAYAEECDFDSASFFAASPIIGSELLRECLRQDFVRKDVELYRMTYKQGVIDVPGLWSGTEIGELAAQFNRDFNSVRSRRSVRQWQATQY